MRFVKTACVVTLCALAACQQTPPLPGQKLGKPYEVGGKRYYPEYDETYDKTGLASWYGPGFHGKYTANGEVYNQNALTAAHPTLPMPSVVRVTNLSNGESVIVRINDRGPFVKNRLIDLSKGSAQAIGIKSTTMVRVQFLKDETEEFIASYENGGKPISMQAFNDRARRQERAEEVQVADNNTSKTETAWPSQKEALSEVQEASNDTGSSTSTSRAEPDQSSYESVPVDSVSSQDLDTPKKRSPRRVSLVREAYAEENNAMPLPKNTGLRKLPDEEAPKKVAAKPAAPVEGNFVIQVGAFSAEGNAHKLGSKLAEIGEPMIDRITVGGKTLWRVRIGPFESHDDAASALDKVYDAGQSDAKIVRL